MRQLVPLLHVLLHKLGQLMHKAHCCWPLNLLALASCPTPDESARFRIQRELQWDAQFAQVSRAPCI